MAVSGRRETGPTETEAAPEPSPAAAPYGAGLPTTVLRLQRTAGNRATAQLLRAAAVARETKTKDPVAEAFGAGDLRKALGKKDTAAITSMLFYFGASFNDLREALELLVAKPSLSAAEKDAVRRLWDAFDGPDLDRTLANRSELWFRSLEKGAPLERWNTNDRFDLWLATSPEIITEHQAKRVPGAVDALSDAEYKTLRVDLWLAGSVFQKAWIVKALAAGRTMADVDKFADAIRNQDNSKLMKHLNVVEEDPVSKTGPGIRQQWQMSCGPTSVQVLHAQTDPIYALKLTGAGDVTKLGKNKLIAKEQGNILKGQGSVPTPIGTAGTGAWVETDLNALKAATGVTYKWTPVAATLPTNAKGSAVDVALDKIRSWLHQGIYIPIVIGGAPGQTAHYNVILRHDPSKGYLIHDPAQGYSAWVTRKQFLNNTLAPPLAWTLLAGYDTPTKQAKPKPKPKAPPAKKKGP